MAKRSDFDPTVSLPPGLDIPAIRRAIDYVEKQLAELEQVVVVERISLES